MFIASTNMRIQNAIGVTCSLNEATINIRHNNMSRWGLRFIRRPFSINMPTLRVWLI